MELQLELAMDVAAAMLAHTVDREIEEQVVIERSPERIGEPRIVLHASVWNTPHRIEADLAFVPLHERGHLRGWDGEIDRHRARG
jgi:hypothetical protein